MDRRIVACVLAGGTGTRLYPASRERRPKQFLELEGDESLLRRTLDRVAFADERYVLTRESLAEAVRERAPEAGVLIEPEGKDTGPAMVYAAWRLREAGRRSGSRNEEPVLVCLPSDHRVGDDAAFARALERAARVAAETDGLVALGVEPTRPATGYGYVVPETTLDARTDRERGSADLEAPDVSAPVRRFHEKPDRETAETLIADGAYWNAGIFAWTPGALLREARASPLAPLVEALEDGDPERGFDAVDAISVDYAVMERASEASVTPLAVEWDDLGTWDAIGRVLEEAEETGTTGANAVLHGTDALPIDASGNVVAAPEKHVSLVGVDDLVVAVYDDQVLVVPREDAQRVREVVSRLREDDRF